MFALFIISLGLLVFMQNLLAFLFGGDTKSVRPGALPSYEVGGLVVTPYHLAVVVVCLIVFPLVQWSATRTRTGKAIQALSSNRELADVVGVDVPRLYLVVFALGSGLAGIAAALLSIDLGVNPGHGLHRHHLRRHLGHHRRRGPPAGRGVWWVPAGAAAEPGGSGPPLAWQDVVVYGLLFVVLLLRPQGLFGQRLITRQV